LGKIPAPPIGEVIALLKMVPPWQRDIEEIFKPLEALAAPIAWPNPEGPSEGDTHKGLGTRIVTALRQQLNSTLETKTDSQGYRCELLILEPR
jgi:hypothetical protein